MVVVLVGNSDLWLEHADLGEGDVAGLEVVVVLEGHIAGVPVVVRRTVGFLERSELLAHGHLTLHHSAEIPSGEDAVMGDQVVHGVGLVVVQVLEVGGVRVAQEEWHEGVTIIHSVELLAFHELLQVVLDHRGLCDGSRLSTGGLNTDAITESEDVLEALVLESVRVHIDDAIAVGDLGSEQLVVGLAGRVDHSGEEVLLDDLTVVDIAEGGDLP